MVLSFKRQKEEKYTRYTEIMKGFEILLLFSSSVNSKISLCGRSCLAVDQAHFLSLLGAGLDWIPSSFCSWIQPHDYVLPNGTWAEVICALPGLAHQNLHANLFVLFLLSLDGRRCTPFLLEKVERPEGRIWGPGVTPRRTAVIVNLCAQEMNVYCLGAIVQFRALFVPVELDIIISLGNFIPPI